MIKSPLGIRQEFFNGLTRKEQDFLKMLFARKYTRDDFMKKFYFESKSGYYNFRKKLKNKISTQNGLVSVQVIKAN